MPVISEIVGKEGVYQFLNDVYKIGEVIKSSQLELLFEKTKVSSDLFSELIKCGLFIHSPDGFYISSLGKKITLLLKVINGDSDIYELYNQLLSVNPEYRQYELITKNITDYFIDSIERHSDFIRIYICSPWIRLDEFHLTKFRNAVLKASQYYKSLQIKILTKPKEMYNNWSASIETFRAFIDLGAEIMTHRKLHAKLYISEPGSLGGIHYAILGSENLTGRGNIELAIKIKNDNYILRKLHQYFFEILEESEILKEV